MGVFVQTQKRIINFYMFPGPVLCIMIRERYVILKAVLHSKLYIYSS